MLIKHYMAYDTKERDANGELLELPLSPPVILLKELLEYVPIKTYNHLWILLNRKKKDGLTQLSSNRGIAICKVWLEEEIVNE